ncbi:MAG: hypothetical protein JXR88_01035, partial [Clostridia bacterium]|nr:hypothetical protein [Clostridia bacterium]
MKKRMFKRIISLILCFSMFMPTISSFAYVPETTVEESSQYEWREVDGSEIGKTPGVTYRVKFVRQPGSDYVTTTKPGSGVSYVTIPAVVESVKRTSTKPGYWEYDVPYTAVESYQTGTKEITVADGYFKPVTRTRDKQEFVGYDIVVTKKSWTETWTEQVRVYGTITPGYDKEVKVLVKAGYYKYVTAYDETGRRVSEKVWVNPVYRTELQWVPPVKGYYYETQKRSKVHPEETKEVPVYRTVKETYTVKVWVPPVTDTVPVFSNRTVTKYKDVWHPAVTTTYYEEEEITPTSYHVTIPAKWVADVSTASIARTYSVWLSNGTTTSGYLQGSIKKTMDGSNLTSGDIMLIDGTYYIVGGGSYSNGSFDPAVYFSTNKLYKTSSERDAALRSMGLEVSVAGKTRLLEMLEIAQRSGFDQVVSAIHAKLAQIAEEDRKALLKSNLIAEIDVASKDRLREIISLANTEGLTQVADQAKDKLVSTYMALIASGTEEQLNSIISEVKESFLSGVKIAAENRLNELNNSNSNTGSGSDTSNSTHTYFNDIWDENGVSYEGYIENGVTYLKSTNEPLSTTKKWIVLSSGKYYEKGVGEVFNFNLDTYRSIINNLKNGSLDEVALNTELDKAKSIGVSWLVESIQSRISDAKDNSSTNNNTTLPDYEIARIIDEIRLIDKSTSAGNKSLVDYYNKYKGYPEIVNAIKGMGKYYYYNSTSKQYFEKDLPQEENINYTISTKLAYEEWMASIENQPGDTTANPFQEIGVELDIREFFDEKELNRFNKLLVLRDMLKTGPVEFSSLNDDYQLLLSELGNFWNDPAGYEEKLWMIREDLGLSNLSSQTAVDDSLINVYLQTEMNVANDRYVNYKEQSQLLSEAVGAYVGMLDKQSRGVYKKEYYQSLSDSNYATIFMYGHDVSTSFNNDKNSSAEVLLFKYFERGAVKLRDFGFLGEIYNFNEIERLLSENITLEEYANIMGPIWEMNYIFSSSEDMVEDTKLMFALVAAFYFSYLIVPNLAIELGVALEMGMGKEAVVAALGKSLVSLGSLDDANDVLNSIMGFSTGDIKAGIMNAAFVGVPASIQGIKTLAKRATRESIEKTIKQALEVMRKEEVAELLTDDIIENIFKNYGIDDLNQIAGLTGSKALNTGGSLKINLELFSVENNMINVVELEKFFLKDTSELYSKNMSSFGTISKEQYVNDAIELATRNINDTSAIAKKFDDGLEVVYDKTTGSAVILKDSLEIKDYVKLEPGMTIDQVIKSIEGASNLVRQYTNYGDYSDAVKQIAKQTNKSKEEILAEIHQTYNLSKDSVGDLLVVSDVKYLEDIPFDVDGNLQVDWPTNRGFVESTVQSVDRNNMLPEQWDRVGSMRGENFTTLPDSGVPYSYSERAIPYIENPSARHVGSFNNTDYYNAIDAINSKDIEALNAIVTKNGKDAISIDELNLIKDEYDYFIKKIEEEMGSINATYGLKGYAAPWKDSVGDTLLSGGAEQIVTPLSGNRLLRDELRPFQTTNYFLLKIILNDKLNTVL